MTHRIRFLIPVILLAAASNAAADNRPDVELPATIQSGPATGTELPIFTADRVTKSACVHCAMT